MADTKISALTDGTTPAGTDQIPAARTGGTTVKLTWTEMLAAVKAVTLDLFAAPAANVAMNAKKITGVAVATAATDVASLANTIDQFGTPAADIAMGTHKFTGLSAGSGAGHSLRYEQLFSAGAVPIADIADPTTGKVIGSAGSAAAAVFPPGYEIGYDQITSNVTVSSGTEATGTTVISCAAHTFDGGPVMVEFYSPEVSTAANDWCGVSLFESTTEIALIAFIRATATADGWPMTGKIRFTPSAASHTYTVTAYRSTGSATIRGGAGGTAGTAPCFVRFTKV